MKLMTFALGSMALVSSLAQAEVQSIKGSDTLAGVITDAIIASGMDDRLAYTGGGSTLGEGALVAGEQGFAPMSREFKPAALAAAQAKGVAPVAHLVGLDGIGVFVSASNGVNAMSFDTLKKIYSCELTQWSQVPGSNATGAIKAYRRNDVSGTTDTFKSLVGLTAFGACVTVAAETSDIAAATADNAGAVGYSGLSAGRDGNKALALTKAADGTAVKPTVANIRNKTYPLARGLYVYEATGTLTVNAVEKQLLKNLLSRSFLDPILQDNEFFTLD